MEKRYIEINGVKQGMILLGEEKDKPVLLFLSGGPGIPEYLLEARYPSGLEKDFIVCYWDYRGTGLSYHRRMDPEKMTLSQYRKDAIAVTNYLIKEFHKEKIYLMAHSFGTCIGIELAKTKPELYYAYIAVSQITNQPKSERMAYRYMVEQYKKFGNMKMVHKLQQYPVIESEEGLKNYLKSSVRDGCMHDLGIGTTHKMKSVVKEIFFPSLRLKGYSIRQRLNIWRGKLFAAKTKVREDSFAFNAFDKIETINIPIYFFAGRYDYTCCYYLQKEYYKQLKAPRKKFYTFEESAHSPVFEEPIKTRKIIEKEILAKSELLR
ncbi:MAG: alpha/beta hydrolase [bacterium]|nr:alpha/beta hydrolase [bacterium]